MTSIFVKAILKGDENNPLVLYDLYMEDMLIKYDVGEYLGSGKDAIKEAKLGNVKLSQDIQITNPADGKKLAELMQKYYAVANPVLLPLKEATDKIPEIKRKYETARRNKTTVAEMPYDPTFPRLGAGEKLVNVWEGWLNKLENANKRIQSARKDYNDLIFGKYEYRWQLNYQAPEDNFTGEDSSGRVRNLGLGLALDAMDKANKQLLELSDLHDYVTGMDLRAFMELNVPLIADTITQHQKLFTQYEKKKPELIEIIKEIKKVLASSFSAKDSKVKITSRQFLGFLNETVRSNKEIERLVREMGTKKEVKNSKGETEIQYTQREKTKRQNTIHEELRRLYSKSVEDEGDLATLLDYAIFYPKQFEMSMKGAFKQTIQQLGKMASLSQTDSTSNKLKTVIENLEEERKRIMKVLSKAKKVSNEAEPPQKKGGSKDSLSEQGLTDTFNFLEKFATSVRNYRVGGDRNKILAQTFDENVIVKSQILDDYLEKDSEKFKQIMNSFALIGAKGKGRKTSTVYDEGNPNHLKIIQASNKVIDELEKTDKSDIINMLRYVADTTNLVSRNIGLVETDLDALDDFVEISNSAIKDVEEEFYGFADELLKKKKATNEEMVKLQEMSNSITTEYDEIIEDLNEMVQEIETQTEVKDTGAGASVKVKDGEVDRTGEQDVEEGKDLSTAEVQQLNKIQAKIAEFEKGRSERLASRDNLIEELKGMVSVE